MVYEVVVQGNPRQIEIRIHEVGKQGVKGRSPAMVLANTVFAGVLKRR